MKIRPKEPFFDKKKHLCTDDLQKIFAGASWERMGTLHCIVQRQEDGSRKTPDTAFLCISNGLIGDRWAQDPKKKIVEQIAIMDWRIAKVIANGQSITLFGDNLFIDWDFSYISAGTQCALGDAVIEITPEPHTGCAKFAKRFGKDALLYTCQEPHHHVRGVYARVVSSGMVCVGDVIKPIA